MHACVATWLSHKFVIALGQALAQMHYPALWHRLPLTTGKSHTISRLCCGASKRPLGASLLQ